MVQTKPPDRFFGIIHQNNRSGTKDSDGEKQAINPISHAFQWQTKTLITNLVCSMNPARRSLLKTGNSEEQEEDGR